MRFDRKRRETIEDAMIKAVETFVDEICPVCGGKVTPGISSLDPKEVQMTCPRCGIVGGMSASLYDTWQRYAEAERLAA